MDATTIRILQAALRTILIDFPIRTAKVVLQDLPIKYIFMSGSVYFLGRVVVNSTPNCADYSVTCSALKNAATYAARASGQNKQSKDVAYKAFIGFLNGGAYSILNYKTLKNTEAIAIETLESKIFSDNTKEGLILGTSLTLLSLVADSVIDKLAKEPDLHITNTSICLSGGMPGNESHEDL
jgi:hypothetical protein